MRSYETSRTVFGLFEFLAWAGIIGGGVLLFIGLQGFFQRGDFGGPSPQAILALPGLLLMVYGLLSVVIVQTGRAGVDTAELTGQILKVARDQLEVSQQSLRASEMMVRSYASLALKGNEDRPLADYGAALASGRKDASEEGPATSGATLSTSADGLVHAPVVDSLTRYQGREIVYSGSAYIVEGERFATLPGAKGYVDELLKAKR